MKWKIKYTGKIVKNWEIQITETRLRLDEWVTVNMD